MRRAALLIVLMVLFAFAARAASQQPADAAHGSEKVAAEGHHSATFLGLPAWIWKLANMIAFLAFLGWLIGGPIQRALAERHQRILGEAQEARDRRAKSDAMASDLQTRLRQLEEDIRSLRERAVADGERQKQEMIAAANAEAQKILQNARKEVDNRVRNARKELTEYAGQLASERAEQLLRDKITEGDRKKLFSESVREVERA